MEKNVRYALSGFLGLTLALCVLTALLSHRLQQQHQRLATFMSQHSARVGLLETFHQEELAEIERRSDHDGN